MPPSRYVSSNRFLRLTVFLTVAFVVLLVLHAGLGALGSPPATRRVLVVAWVVAVPVGAWWVWKSGGDGASGH